MINEKGRIALSVVYGLAALTFVICLLAVLVDFPLFPLRMDNLSWTAAWLKMTVGDFYLLAACFCLVLISSEGWQRGGLWSLCLCCLGSPVACVYLIWRALSDQPLHMEHRRPESHRMLE